MLFTSCRITGKKLLLHRINKIEYGRLFTLEEKRSFFHSIDIYCSLPETVFSGEIAKS